MIFFIFLKTACVKHTFLMTSQVKHLTFVGDAALQTFFHELWYLTLCELHSFLYALPTAKIPSLLCDHLTTSLSVLVPAKSPTASNNLGTLYYPIIQKSSEIEIPTLYCPAITNHCLRIGAQNKQIRKQVFRGVCLIHTSHQNLVLLPSPTLICKFASNLGHKFLIAFQTPAP